MWTTFHNAAERETVSSLIVSMSMHACDQDALRVCGRAHTGSPPVLQTTACRLLDFCTLTHGHYGGEGVLLHERTLCDFFTSSLSPRDGLQLEHAVCRGTTGRVICPTLPQYMRSANRIGLTCPECAETAHRQTGRWCSLTSHCIPFLSNCPIHHCLLVLTDAISWPEFSAISVSSVQARRNSRLLAAFAHDQAQCRTMGRSVEDLREQLVLHGYVSARGRLETMRLASDVSALLSHGFEDGRLTAWTRDYRGLPDRLSRLFQNRKRPHPIEVAMTRVAIHVLDFPAHDPVDAVKNLAHPALPN